MKLHIVRHDYTRDICRGFFYAEGKEWSRLCTLEASLPRDLSKYIGHALPPGEYSLTCEEGAVLYKGVLVRIPWMRLDGVKWFPRAIITCEEKTDALPRCGQIFLGKERADNDYALINPDNEAMKVWARLSAEAFSSSEPIMLVIEHDSELEFEDTYRDKARLEAEERESNEKKEKLINELYYG